MLSDPRNISQLTSQLLCAPAIWHVQDQSDTALRVLYLFDGAIARKIRQQGGKTLLNGSNSPSYLSTHDWITAVNRGADKHSALWKHTLILGGLLRGLKQDDCNTQRLRVDRERLTFELASKVNSCLRGSDVHDAVATTTITVVLCSIWNSVDHDLDTTIEYDLLLPLLFQETFFGKMGLHSGYFLSRIDNDIVQTTNKKLQWSPLSETFTRLRALSNSPLWLHIGPLSSLMAHSIARIRVVGLLKKLVEDLVMFSRSFNLQWRHNKLSEIDSSEETQCLTEQSLQETIPLLWHVMRTSTYAVIVILRSLMERTLFETSLHHELGK